MTYGVQPTGFIRKPLSVILAELEAMMITEFGPGLIQTPQSPMGQINGLMANLIAQLWESAEDVYQSYDPDQAEGSRLEMLGRLRLLERFGFESDVDYRKAITNQGRARIDLQDITRAVSGLDGVTYCQVFINDTGTLDEFTLPIGTVVVAVLGGDDAEIAQAVRRFIVPGITTFGNVRVSTVLDGYCRSLDILRPTIVPVKLEVDVRTFNDRLGCPPPTPTSMRLALVDNLRLLNGDDITYFRVRSVLESLFNTVEVIDIRPERDGLPTGVIGFTEIAQLTFENVEVNVV